MINIKIKPEERIAVEFYLLMQYLKTKYYRVGKVQPFIIDVNDIGPFDVSNFEVFTKKQDVRDLLHTFETLNLISQENVNLSNWPMLDDIPTTYKIELKKKFFTEYAQYESEVLKLSKPRSEAFETKVFKYRGLELNIANATISFKEKIKDIDTERREIKFLEKIMLNNGSVADYRDLAEFMNIQSYNLLATNMDVSRDVQDIKKGLEDYLSILFSDKKIAKEICSYITNVPRRGYKLK